MLERGIIQHIFCFCEHSHLDSPKEDRWEELMEIDTNNRLPSIKRENNLRKYSISNVTETIDKVWQRMYFSELGVVTDFHQMEIRRKVVEL